MNGLSQAKATESVGQSGFQTGSFQMGAVQTGEIQTNELQAGDPRMSQADPESRTAAGPGRSWLALWAYGGVVLLLAQSIARLAPVAAEPLRSGSLSFFQHVLFWGWVLASIYLEGYRGFHLRFVPRVCRRVGLLLDHPTPVRVILGPIYVMGFFDAPPRDKKAAWGVTLAVLCAVFVVRTLAQPWRGIVDGGVVSGLLAGLVSLVWTARSRRVEAREA